MCFSSTFKSHAFNLIDRTTSKCLKRRECLSTHSERLAEGEEDQKTKFLHQNVMKSYWNGTWVYKPVLISMKQSRLQLIKAICYEFLLYNDSTMTAASILRSRMSYMNPWFAVCTSVSYVLDDIPPESRQLCAMPFIVVVNWCSHWAPSYSEGSPLPTVNFLIKTAEEQGTQCLSFYARGQPLQFPASCLLLARSLLATTKATAWVTGSPCLARLGSCNNARAWALTERTTPHETIRY